MKLQDEVAKNLTDFGQMFLQKSNSQLKKLWSAEFLESHLPKFIEAKQAIDRLGSHVDSLNDMHQIKLKYTPEV